MYDNGAWSMDAVLNHLTGFEDQMRLFQFVTNFGLAMWSIDTWAKVPISLMESGRRRSVSHLGGRARICDQIMSSALQRP